MTTGGVLLDGASVIAEGHTILAPTRLALTAHRIAVIGANGSGKSTFARLLNGLIPPTEGSVTVHGLDSVRDRAALRRRVGFVFTNPEAQILMPTPAEDVALSLPAVPRAERADRARAALREFGLDELADAPAMSLSGGQKQLLALASVVVTEPGLLVADEPTTLLDLRNARRIGDLLLAQSAQLVVVTHDLDLAARCDVAVRFDRGEVADVGEPAAVIETYRRECG